MAVSYARLQPKLNLVHRQPPPTIKPQAALNDREAMETEVISTSACAHLNPFHALP